MNKDANGTSHRSNEEDKFSELQDIILGSEKEQLSRLQKRMEDPELRAKDVSDILPEAIALRADKDKKLANALMSNIEESLKVSVAKDPKFLSDALYPIMGPSIRKSIYEALSNMIQSLNHSLEQSFSWNGLKWRLESIRTGKPFAEVVLLNTLLYQV
jgi:OOP family OmpA-OmpF porin